MLTTSARMAQKLKAALAEKGLSQVELARMCGASKQAVQSWVKTGRIDKSHLPKFVEIFGRPLEWWLDTDENTSTTARLIESSNINNQFNKWPFSSINQKEYAQLSERQMGMVEGYIRAMLQERIEVKRNGTYDDI